MPEVAGGAANRTSEGGLSGWWNPTVRRRLKLIPSPRRLERSCLHTSTDCWWTGSARDFKAVPELSRVDELMMGTWESRRVSDYPDRHRVPGLAGPGA